MSAAGWRVERLGYSAGPWRILTADGEQVTFGAELIHTQGGPVVVPRIGYDTKAAAVAGMGEIAASLHAHVLALQAEKKVTERG